QFIEYDQTIPAMGIKKFLRVQVRPDVSMPLKRKKNPSRAVASRRNSTESRWLHPADRSFCSNVGMERNIARNNFSGEKDSGSNLRGDFGSRSLIPKSTILESGQKIAFKEHDRWHNLDKEGSDRSVGDNESMELILTEENNPLIILEGKKCQRFNAMAHTLALEGRRQQASRVWSEGVLVLVMKLVAFDRKNWLQNK
ncbi:hypothetical protein J1N35_008517, partial [Gossypium stocksii]